jgi:hypothetical protein
MSSYGEMRAAIIDGFGIGEAGALMFEYVRTQSRAIVETVQPLPKEPTQPLEHFTDVAALNEVIDSADFRRKLMAARDYEGDVIRVDATLYAYDPICAGSGDMWRQYWAEMQRVLRRRLGPAAGAPSDRKEKVRDWWTQSLFLWGFSMARSPQPKGHRWVGLATMDEINAVPVLLTPEAWDGIVSNLFAGRERAWEVSVTARVRQRESGGEGSGTLREVFEVLERPNYLVVHSAEQINRHEKSTFFSAYIWALFQTPQGRKYGLWEHANIADSDLFDEGVERLVRKARELCAPDYQVVAALAPEVAEALARR